MNECFKNFFINIMQGISGLIPKKKNLWLFGAWEGRIYADNTKYMFEYIAKCQPQINAVWLTRDRSVVSEVRKKGLRCYHMLSLNGICLSLRTEVVFETEGNWDVSPFVNMKKTKVIQLWHGIAGKSAKWKDKEGNPMYNEKSRKIMNSYFWMASSEKYIETFSNLFGVSHNRFSITGYPRNDTFIEKPSNSHIENLIGRHRNSRWIIYMPTHRNFGSEAIPIKDFLLVDQRLKEENVFMLYKPHFHELKNVLPYEDKFTNIILAKDQKKYADVYSYLHYFDLLISDYSSVVYDFLCADKPIVLFTYDIEHYRNEDAGLWDFYEEIPAGPFTYSWDETLGEVFSLLKEDTWQMRRKICRDVFHPYDDGKNCHRVYEVVKNLCR